MAGITRGLRLQSIATPQTYVEAFSIFLENETYAQYAEDMQSDATRDSSTPPSLLDIIQVWMASGDAIRVCPTYESFLLAVIGIIDWWSAFGKTEIVGSYLWPDFSEGKNGTTALPVEVLFNDADGSTLVFDHPALRRENYEAESARWNRYSPKGTS